MYQSVTAAVIINWRFYRLLNVPQNLPICARSYKCQKIISAVERSRFPWFTKPCEARCSRVDWWRCPRMHTL